VEEQGKGREILLTGALGDGLEQPVANAKSPTGFVRVHGSRMVAARNLL
jgi:hypothetical protein